MSLRPRITPSVVLASLALIVASGGTAYAAATIGSAQIKNDSIRSIDVKNGDLTRADIRNGTLRGFDIQDGSIQAVDLAPGVAGEGSRWALVDKDGAIIAQSGGFSINAAYPELPNTAAEGQPSNALRAAGNVYVNANENLDDNAITVSIALQNQTDQDGNGNTNGRASGPDANAEFSGEITATVCGIAGIVACAPPGSNQRDHFVVSPRLSDGSVTTAATHKRFYVVISGDSSDLTDAGKAIPAVALP